jgi:hypothetical protein
MLRRGTFVWQWAAEEKNSAPKVIVELKKDMLLSFQNELSVLRRDRLNREGRRAHDLTQKWAEKIEERSEMHMTNLGWCIMGAMGLGRIVILNHWFLLNVDCCCVHWYALLVGESLWCNESMLVAWDGEAIVAPSVLVHACSSPRLHMLMI